MSAEHWGRQTGQGFIKHKTGLVIGGLIGLFTGGFFGLLFGGAVGYFLERMLKKVKSIAPQQLFFRATFAVMGKIAKADGRVTESEIEFARAVMARMQLNEQAKRRAIEYFNEGKQPDFDMAKVLKPLALILRGRLSVKLMFLEMQLQTAMADGDMSAAELKVIEEICHLLQFTSLEMQAVVQRIRAAQNFAKHSHEWQQQPGLNDAQLLEDAYGVLGVPTSATDAEIKKAWRKLMSQHHPDKLVAKGLPEEMLELAKEKTQEIQSAYDRIKVARGMR
ncbi:co-chaperone DjlA [Nitrincola tibetensis]|uniref:Co-chaperone protein DjlA n=1 Tax=Nitrincola tibetensis TaxID=2219697 RepID=A0A364NRD4_9GAMM|nr:co-chaperone DjlA [Nitrincola tibetensis]RAU19668.1 co-chaperone DjlA [Nitrincola tibetensis]